MLECEELPQLGVLTHCFVVVVVVFCLFVCLFVFCCIRTFKQLLSRKSTIPLSDLGVLIDANANATKPYR